MKKQKVLKSFVARANALARRPAGGANTECTRRAYRGWSVQLNRAEI